MSVCVYIYIYIYIYVQVDIWALGAVLTELLTLAPLFPGTNDIDQVAKQDRSIYTHIYIYIYINVYIDIIRLAVIVKDQIVDH